MIDLRIVTILCLCVLSTSAAPTLRHEDAGRQLQWTPCKIDWGFFAADIHVELDCATLNVPLDHTNLTSNKMLPLQLAKVNATKAPFLGSIILNFGGPGESGIQDLASLGAVYRR